MSGNVLRSVCTAALVTATALAVVPFAPTATAEPAPGPGGGPTTPGTATSAPASPPAPAPGSTQGSAPSGIAGMLTTLQRLYREAEESGEAYKATDVELDRLRAESARLGGGLDRARTALELSRNDAGRLAREQYQGRSGLSGYVRLMLARDPQSALDQGHLMERAARGRAATLARLTTGEKRADALATAARQALARRQVLAERQKKQRDTVRTRLGAVTELLASLSTEQIAALDALEKAATDKAQRELIASGALGTGTGAAPGAPGAARSSATPSAAGDEALEYAVDQIGKPYAWGAEGPGSFDCSGLTSRAWARAGRTVPRTSQQQWRELPRVPLNRLRPGDLVVYFPKATHVAIYLGDGMVIQAPRPGARVKVSPIAANPLLGAVRPDPGATPMASYRRPELPPGALDGSDLGNGTGTTGGTDVLAADGAR